jgi:hypothetical protein
MAFPGLVAANNLSDAADREAVWGNLGNGINVVILATNFIRNNTMVGAVAGTPGTLPTNWGLANGAALSYSVIGTGVDDEISYIDVRFFGTNILNQEVSFYFEQNGIIAAAQGQTWTHSCYAKIVAGSLAGIGSLDLPELGGELFLIGEQSPLGFTAVEFPSVHFNYASLAGPFSECRVSQSHTFTNPLVNYVLPRLDVNFGTPTAIDFTLRIGMPQLERSEYFTPPIATTNAAASALATVSLSLEGDDILELTGVRIASVADFVRIKGLATPAQPRLTTAAANAGSGIALRDDALVKASPSSEGDFFITRGTLDGQSLRVNGLGIASISGSPFSGSTASCPLSISSFAAPTNLRLNNAMTSGTLAFPEKAIPIETNDFILYAKAGQS